MSTFATVDHVTLQIFPGRCDLLVVAEEVGTAYGESESDPRAPFNHCRFCVSPLQLYNHLYQKLITTTTTDAKEEGYWYAEL